MADQEDAAVLAELGGELFLASEDGKAPETARLLDLNAPDNHREGSIRRRRSWQLLKKDTSRWSLCWRIEEVILRRAT